MMRYQWLLITLFQGSIAWLTFLAIREDNKFEWTALGDSFASGVGSTNYIDGRRCLRYDQGYPTTKWRQELCKQRPYIQQRCLFWSAVRRC